LKLFFGILPVAALVAYSQVIVKWRLIELGYRGDEITLWGKILGYLALLRDPIILSSFVAALLASFAWVLVVARFPLSWAFPVYQGLTFALVLVFSWLVLGEQLTGQKMLAVALILAGVALGVID